MHTVCCKKTAPYYSGQSLDEANIWHHRSSTLSFNQWRSCRFISKGLPVIRSLGPKMAVFSLKRSVCQSASCSLVMYQLPATDIMGESRPILRLHIECEVCPHSIRVAA